MPTEETATTEQAPPSDASTATPEPDAPLGDAGKKALESERRARRAAEKAAEEYAARVKEFEDRDKSEQEKLAEQLQKLKAEAEQAKIETLRLKVGRDLPDDLHEFLTATTEDDLRAQVEKLKAATAAAGPKKPAPDPAQGAKPDTAGPSQLSRADLARLSPAQIEEARVAGRLDDILAGRA